MPLGFAAITERAPVIAYLGLGANLDDPRRQLSEALERLNAAEEVEVTRISAFYRNPPLGPADQPWYINAAARVRTRLGPEELLRLLQQVEAALGRVRGEHWGPRRLDLDLLLYNGEVIFAPDLVVPHPEMHRRGFVLVPLAEIAPQAWHPVLGKSAGDLLSELNPADRAAVQPVAAD
jgi:2-amino-4-hydroxy-6-hydroxymethyldihydropteridine diphosphokinase